MAKTDDFFPTHQHVNGGLYRVHAREFHWEPEWDRPAVLYENPEGVLIGRFQDVFEDRFRPIFRVVQTFEEPESRGDPRWIVLAMAVGLLMFALAVVGAWDLITGVGSVCI